MNARPPVIGLMLGDVTGIGPEISAKLLASGTLIGVMVTSVKPDSMKVRPVTNAVGSLGSSISSGLMPRMENSERG